MTSQTRLDRTIAAAAVALMLLLHSIVAGVVGGAMAASPDTLSGGVICSAHRGVDAPSVPGHHPPLPECCVVGCSVASGQGALSQPLATPWPLAVGRVVVFAAIQQSIDHAARHFPFSPRAPPLTV